MASFKSACLETLQHEGGYSSGKGDHGGETYMGISRRWHPRWEGWEEIDRIKATRKIKWNEYNLVEVESVMRIYRDVYWGPIRGDQIIDQVIANMVFDHAVNAGVGDAAKLLQEAVGVKRDGAIGPVTIGAVNGGLPAGPARLRRTLFYLRMKFYVEEAGKSLLQEANLPSWTSRALKSYSGEI